MPIRLENNVIHLKTMSFKRNDVRSKTTFSFSITSFIYTQLWAQAGFPGPKQFKKAVLDHKQFQKVQIVFKN